MHGDEDKASGVGARPALSISQIHGEPLDGPSVTGLAERDRASNVDALVSSFLLELNVLSQDPDAGQDAPPLAQPPTGLAPESQADAATVTHAVDIHEALLHFESEIDSDALNAELAATVGELEREQLKVPPVPQQETADGAVAVVSEKILPIPAISPDADRPDAEVQPAPAQKPTARPLQTRAPNKSPDIETALRRVFSEERRRRRQVLAGTLSILFVIIAVVAWVFFR